MPLDPNIALSYRSNVEPQSNALMRALQIRGMQQQGELARLQFEDARAQRAIQMQNSLLAQQQAQQQAATAQARRAFMDRYNALSGPAMPIEQLPQAALTSGLYSAEEANKMRDVAAPKGPKVARTITIPGPDGKPMAQQYDEAGNPVGQPVRSYEKPADQSPLSKLIAERDLLPPGSPMRAIYDRAITKASTHQDAASVQVSYGAPMAGVDEDGNPVFFQPSKDGRPPSIVKGVKPPPRQMSDGAAEKFASNAVTLGKIDRALAEIDKRPGSLGIQNVLPDAIVQRVDPEGVDVRAMVADIAGQKIHDRSGAAVTVGEAERLKPYIPTATDRPEVAKKKLTLFRSEYAAMQQALATGASIKQAAASGAKGAAKAPSSKASGDGWSYVGPAGN